MKFDTIKKVLIAAAAIGVGVRYANIYLFHVVLVVAVIGFFKFNLIDGFAIRVRRLYTRAHYCLYALFAWYSVSILWSPSAQFSLMYIAYYAFGLIITLAILYYCEDEGKLNLIFKILATVFIIEMLIGIGESLQLFRYPLSPFSPYKVYFGLDKKISDVVDLSRILSKFAPTGFGRNTNTFTVLMTMILPFFLMQKNSLIRLLGSASLFFLAFASGSRGNIIAMVLVLIVYLFLFIKKSKLILLMIVLSIVLGIGYAALSESKYTQQISDSFVALQLFASGDASKYRSGGSIDIRRNLIAHGMEALLDVYGWGVGAGGALYLETKQGGLGKSRITSMHNHWIETLVDCGVVMFMVLVAFYSFCMLCLYRIYKASFNSKMRFYAGSTFLSMLGFFIGAISASGVLYFFPMWIMYGFVLAIINVDRKERKINEQYKSCDVGFGT